MSKRGLSKNHLLPENPTWIEFTRTDGSEGQWGSVNTERVVDHEGHVNFHRPADLNEPICIKWRKDAGAALAMRMGMPEGPAYVLRAWPQGYQMFDHNKGPQAAPRHDMYLIGSTHVNRFRSVPEFIPHALWLMQDSTLDRSNCSCKYCTKTPQRRITLEMGLTQRRSTPTDSPTPSRVLKPREAREHRERKLAQVKPYAAVRRAPKPVKQPGPPKQAMLQERNLDLRAAYSRTNMRLQRLFRVGELLWCAVDPPIRGKSDEETIEFWPGLVEETKLQHETIPRSEQNGTASGNDMHMETDANHENDHPSASMDPASTQSMVDGDESPTPWVVRQSTVYKMKLLAVSMSILLPDDQVLPYQAYVPPSSLLDSIRGIDPVQLDPRPERIAAFNPCPAPPEGPENAAGFLDNGLGFIEAAAPYTLAMQIAASLAGYWTPTDEWDFKFSVAPQSASARLPPAPAPEAAAGSVSSAQSLHSVIVASMSNNAALHADAVGNSGSISSGPSSAPANTPQTDLETRMLGQPIQSLSVTQSFTQMRYQGLWWGAERIWTDELIRLKVARRQIAPNGAENIYPPAGPSQSTIEYNDKVAADHGLPPGSLEEAGAGARGVFMRLEGLFVVDVPKPSEQGTKKECRASGMLYELADEDWEDPLEKASNEKAKADGSGSAPGNEFGSANQLLANTSSVSTNDIGAEPSQTGPSFMPGPSPLKPPPLPNPDPAVPVSSTASTTLAETLASNEKLARQHSPNVQLSHPVDSNPYLLPDAPKGFKFRPILPPGHEAVVALTLISGRYYPQLLAHPLLHPIVHQALSTPVKEGGLNDHNHLWALDGLAPGFYNAVDPSKWKPSRLAMMRDADKEARVALDHHWEQIRKERTGEMKSEEVLSDVAAAEETHEMEVDVAA